jgi:hypothetical protein
MICEIINPSDPYTLQTDNFDAAALAVWLIGRGTFGLKTVGVPESEHQSTPILFGWQEWARGRYLPSVDAYIEAHRREIAAACDSVMIGSVDVRRAFTTAIAYMAPERVREYRAEIYDQQRTSLNRIGESFWAYADKLRANEVKGATNAHV